MFFKKIRSQSSSKSTKQINRVASHSSSSHADIPSGKEPNVMTNYDEDGRTEAEAKDYQEFLAKAKRDEEKAEKKRLREIQKAREINMSPWAGRIRDEERQTALTSSRLDLAATQKRKEVLCHRHTPYPKQPVQKDNVVTKENPMTKAHILLFFDPWA